MITGANENIKKVDVSPDMRFYNLLESYPYTIRIALCEYIDNALEAYQAARNVDSFSPKLPKKLEVSITISNNKIVIDDNGTGISRNEIQRAMKPAYKPAEQSLSEFGIGMKAASMWFGHKWELESYPIDGTEPFKLSFDLDKLLKINSTTIEVEELQNPNNRSGVKIILTKIRNMPNEVYAARAWEELQETYQLFCSRKDPEPILKINFNFHDKSFPKKDFTQLIVANEPLHFPECRYRNAKLYAIGDHKTWKENVEFNFNGKIVRGFISLGRESSQISNPGLRLFRFGRLIKGMEKSPNRPIDLVGTANKAAPSRFYAELHLDGQPISNSKGEFIFDEYNFITELKANSKVAEYINQAENYRSIKAQGGDYKSFSSWQEFEDETGSTRNKTDSEKSSYKRITNQNAKSRRSNYRFKKMSAPTTFLLLDNFLSSAIQLYNENKIWPFCLVYRAILEVSIIDNIKHCHIDHYDHVKEKAIISLYKYLQGNANIIPQHYETLRRTLKESNKDNQPFLGILNLASHGRYTPTKNEVKDLLRNTQQLIEWAFDREDAS